MCDGVEPPAPARLRRYCFKKERRRQGVNEGRKEDVNQVRGDYIIYYIRTNSRVLARGAGEIFDGTAG